MKTTTQQNRQFFGSQGTLIAFSDEELKELLNQEVISQDIARAALENLIAIRKDIRELIEATCSRI
jgi:hypothetical protein